MKTIKKIIMATIICFTVICGIRANSLAADKEMDYWTNKETYQFFIMDIYNFSLVSIQQGSMEHKLASMCIKRA